MDKTASVLVERTIIHPVYKKRVKRSKKYQVHDELGTVVGQKVRFVASRRYSKTKRWKVTEIVNSARSKEQGAKKKT